MSSPRNNFWGPLVKRLEQMVCLYQCDGDGDLTFLACPPPKKFHIVVVVETESGEKTEYKVAIYEESQPGGPAGVPSAETSVGEPARRTSERKKSSNHTSVLTGPRGPPKRDALEITRPYRKRRRASGPGKTAAVTITTRPALEPLDANAIPTNRPRTTVAQTTKEVADLVEDDEHPPEDPRNDKAKNLYGMLMEAATYPRVPGDHFREPLCSRRGMNTTDEETTKKAVKIMERNAQLDDK
ncbi:hypothetical protein IFR05_017469, partial [Cadophora sp. M221]